MFKRTLSAALCAATIASAQTSDLTADGPAGSLAGTLVGGTGDVAALILPGSGPTDRDGNNPFGTRADSYRLLAEALSAAGIPTLRIDKRGIGGSEGDGNDVSLAAYRDDTAAWINQLQSETAAECTWLIGHSEGALVALASADLPDLCGLILLAPPGRPMGQLLVDQFRANPMTSAIIDPLEAAVHALERGETPDLSNVPPQVATMFMPPVVDYLTELVQTDPADLISNVSLPVLIVHGTSDIQVRPSEADPLRNAAPDAEAVVLAGMTHMLKASATLEESEDFGAYVAASLATYSDPDLPLHTELVPALVDFIERNR